MAALPRLNELKLRRVLLLGAIFFLIAPLVVHATVSVTAATGGSAISADTTGGSYTSLAGPVISEGATADIGTGTIILNVPSGFVFDTGGTSPTVLVTRIAGAGSDTRNINDLPSGTNAAITSISTTQITFTVTAASSNGVRNSLTWQNVRVRPSAGTPLASGNITKSGTSSIVGVTGSTNFGTLTEVVGAKTQLVITTQPSSTATTNTDFGTKPVVAVRDQFGNTVTNDSSTTVSRSAVLSTQSCGGTAGSGTLSSTPANGAAVSSGVMTYTAMQYSAAENIKICFTSSGITSALSNTITVSAPADSTAPAAVSNLAASATTTSAVYLTWTSPGDDGSSGTATSYDIRYSTATITEGNWSSATPVSGEPTPLVAGSSQAMNVTGLSPSTTYFFAMKTSDEVPNTSTISNVASATTATPADSTPPADVTNLAVSSVATTSVALTWTAPGDDGSSGTATSYDLRYSTSVITSGNFSSATAVSGEPSPSAAGSTENFTVSGLASSTSYYFALKTSDEALNTSGISNVRGATTLNPIPVTTSISPTSKIVGDSGFTMTVSGRDFATTSVVRFNGSSRTTTYVSSTELSATIPSSDLTSAGTFSITVFSPTPSGGTSNSQTFTVNAAADTTAPAAVADLATGSVTTSSIALSWTAPGDDNSTGTATSYDVRYSTSPITAGNFSSATAASGEPTPSVAGTGESMTVSGLTQNTGYYFAIKTSDEVPNTSSISNIVGATTTAETVGTVTVTGGAGAGVAPSKLIFAGKAYPNAFIQFFRRSALDTTFRNTYVLDTETRADGTGNFSKEFLALLESDYFYALEAKDAAGRSSGSQVFRANLSVNDIVSYENVFFPPAFETNGPLVAKGKVLVVSGSGYPGATVFVEVGTTSPSTGTVAASGLFSVSTSTETLPLGNYIVRLHQEYGGVKSRYSSARTITVSPLKYPQADFNKDGKISIQDFGIFLSRWSAKEISVRTTLDVNRDSKINATDLSLFLRALKGI